jgi:hypothetical protein
LINVFTNVADHLQKSISHFNENYLQLYEFPLISFFEPQNWYGLLFVIIGLFFSGFGLFTLSVWIISIVIDYINGEKSANWLVEGMFGNIKNKNELLYFGLGLMFNAVLIFSFFNNDFQTITATLALIFVVINLFLIFYIKFGSPKFIYLIKVENKRLHIFLCLIYAVFGMFLLGFCVDEYRQLTSVALLIFFFVYLSALIYFLFINVEGTFLSEKIPKYSLLNPKEKVDLLSMMFVQFLFSIGQYWYFN